MLAEIDTRSVVPEQRLEFWCESIATAFNDKQLIERPLKTPFNARLRAFELDRLCFSETTGTPHTSTFSPDSQRDVFVAIIPFEGTVVIQQDRREARLQPGDFGFCSLGWSYTIGASTEFQRISISIPGKELRDIFPACNYITATTISLKKGAGILFHDMVHSVYQRIEEIEHYKPAAIAAADALVSLLRGTLHELPQVQDSGPSRLEFYHKERIRGYVKANLRTNLSVDSIAQAVELSPRYVHSLFSKEPMSLMKWVWAERLDRCRHDLGLASLSGRSVSEVAYTWGFNDPAHFSRTFRSRFGTSPTKYREQALRPQMQQMPEQSGLEPLAA